MQTKTRKTNNDLKLPFSWEERRPILQDSFWYIPERIELKNYSFPVFSDNAFFGNDNEVAIEYCSGNGSWISEKAKNHPSINWIAIEKRFDRARKIWLKQQNNDLNNLLVVRSEGLLLTKAYISDCSVSNIYINFPDPWPKRRHFSMRIINPAFINEMHRILKKDCTVTIVTDHTDYSDSIIKDMNECPGFESMIESPYYKELDQEYGSSYFEELFRNQNKNIRLHIFRKK